MIAELPLFKNAAGMVLLAPEGFLRSYWGPDARTLADTQALLNELLHQLRHHRLDKVLVNQEVMHPFTPEEQTWVNHDWLPRAVREAGYRLGAIVVAKDLYARLATSGITSNLQGLPVRFRSFDNDAEAAAWLARQ